jgi:23S rRNA pseudouridine2605 synthase
MSKSANPDSAPESAPEGPSERIAKRMARAGLCSRRDAERWIEAGRVEVNGEKLTSPAFTVTGSDEIIVDGKPLPMIERTRLWLHNKRSGTVTTAKDPEGRRTVFETLPNDLPRVLTVGRLDITTEGLLLLTNDGGLARALELPSTGWLRRYRVRAHGKVTQEQLDALADGIAVDGVLYGSIEAQLEREQGSNVWLTFAMREGKNREVKKVLAALDLDVNRLIRISYGPFQLGDLAEGAVVEVRSRTLRDQLGSKLVEKSGANFDAPLAANAPKIDQQKAKKPPRKIDPLKRLDTKRGRLDDAVDDARGKGSRKAGKPNRSKPNRKGPRADRRR